MTERENYKGSLEELVEKRTAALFAATQEAENRKHIAETALAEIKKLKDQLEAERAYLQDECASSASEKHKLPCRGIGAEKVHI